MTTSERAGAVGGVAATIGIIALFTGCFPVAIVAVIVYLVCAMSSNIRD